MSEASLQPVNSFSIGFDDGTYNELPYAREVAALFRTNHRERTVVAGPRRRCSSKLVVHLDEPFADVSLFPTYHACRSWRASTSRWRCRAMAATSCSAATTPTRRRRWRRGFALDGRRAAAGAGRRSRAALPPTEKKKGLVNKVKRFTAGAATSAGGPRPLPLDGVSRARATRRGSTRRPARRARRAATSTRRCARRSARFGQDDLLNRQLYADLSLYLADDILVKVDRMSMATSLETRAPFLDADVMELAFSMPGHLKIRNGERKWILKQAMRGVLPDRILTRKKEGFSIPMKNWLRRELQPLMRDLLSPERIARRGLFDPAEVTRLIDEHVAGRENHAHTLFPLMVFERWATEHLA